MVNDMASIVTSFDATSGKTLWQGRLGVARREGFSASPVAVDGKVFFTNDDGETFVLKAGPTFELLHVNSLRRESARVAGAGGRPLVLQDRSVPVRDRQSSGQGKGQKAKGKRKSGSVVHRVPIEGTLDLHAFAPRDIPSVVEEYVHAAHEAGLREVRLIHGRGKGVQRAVVHRVLAGHPLVESHWDASESHLGATVVKLIKAKQVKAKGKGRGTVCSLLMHGDVESRRLS